MHLCVKYTYELRRIHGEQIEFESKKRSAVAEVSR